MITVSGTRIIEIGLSIGVSNTWLIQRYALVAVICGIRLLFVNLMVSVLSV